MELIETTIDWAAKITEIIGILIIFLGVIFSLVKFAKNCLRPDTSNYKELRISLGKSILLGLEVLIAADIMATVVTRPNLNSVMVLGLIVLIRILLSLSIQVELEGRFPWQRQNKKEII